MPRYQKDTRLEVWRDEPAYQDEAGAWHYAGAYLVGSVWANVKGTDYSEQYAMSAHWARPIFKFTITRPIWDVTLEDHIRYRGEFFAVKTINELTGRIGHDMVIVCQRDEKFEPER